MLRASRAAVKGAPVRFWLIFAVAFQCSTHAIAASSDADASILHAMRVAENMHFEAQALELRLVQVPAVESVTFLEAPPFDDFQVEIDETLLPSEVRVPILIVQFQKKHFYTSVMATPGVSSEELIAQVTSALLADSEHYHIIEAHPQPAWDVVVLLVLPRWWRSADFVPVLVDATHVHRGTCMVCIPKRCTIQELREDFFALWPREATIVLEGREQYLEDNALIFPTEGTLFRIIPAGGEIEPVICLDQALESLDWVRDVDSLGFPEVLDGRGRALVLCQDYSFVLGYTDRLSFPQLHRQIAVCLDASPPDVHVSLPSEQIEMMAYNGKAVASVFAAEIGQEADRLGRCGLFIDSRDFGRDVSYHRFSSRVLSVDDFQAALELDVPEGYVARVDGYAHRTGQERSYFFHPNAVVTIWVDPVGGPTSSTEDDEGGDDPDGSHQDDGPSADAGDFDQNIETDETGNVGSSSEGSHDGRSRSPRRVLRPVLPIVPEDGLVLPDGVAVFDISAEEPSASTSTDGKFDVDMWMLASRDAVVDDYLLADTSAFPMLPQTALESSDVDSRLGFMADVMLAISQNWESVSQTRDGAERYTISLADVLYEAEPIQDVSTSNFGDFSKVCSTCTGLGDAHVHDLWKFLPFAALHAPPDGLDRPERFSSWVGFCDRPIPPGPGRVLLLTSDGSYCPTSGKGSWGIVVSHAPSENVDEGPGQFIGCMSGTLDDFIELLACPSNETDPFLAEVAGLFWSAVAVVQLRFHGQILFRCDCTPALGGVSGRCGAKAHPFCSAARAVHLGLASYLPHPPLYVHVQGHSGDPANELADGLAVWTARTSTSLTAASLDMNLWKENGGIAISWIPHAFLHRAAPDVVPPLADGVLRWEAEYVKAGMSASELLGPLNWKCPVQNQLPLILYVFIFVSAPSIAFRLHQLMAIALRLVAYMMLRDVSRSWRRAWQMQERTLSDCKRHAHVKERSDVGSFSAFLRAWTKMATLAMRFGSIAGKGSPHLGMLRQFCSRSIVVQCTQNPLA